MRGTKAALVLLAFAASCGGGKESTSPGDTTYPGNGQGPGSGPIGGPTGSTSNQITVADNSFSPSSTTVSVGTTVTWTWAEGLYAAHNVTFNEASVAGSEDKTSGKYSHTFGSAGSFAYRCTNHTGMTGTVVVQ
jgi:plastocyanin